MKYNDNGEWKDVQIKVANAIQNEYGESNNDGYSQNYLNDHIVNVSNEVDEDYKVNLLKSKNLFDGYLVNGYNPTDPSTNTGRLRTNYIKVKPNTTYVCSLIPPTGKTGQFYVYEYTDKGQTPTGTNWKNSGVSFTTGNTTQYISLCLKCTDDSAITPTSFSNIQLEEGNTPSTYVPYSPPSIVVDNEEIYNKEDFDKLLAFDDRIDDRTYSMFLNTSSSSSFDITIKGSIDRHAFLVMGVNNAIGSILSIITTSSSVTNVKNLGTVNLSVSRSGSNISVSGMGTYTYVYVIGYDNFTLYR